MIGKKHFDYILKDILDDSIQPQLSVVDGEIPLYWYIPYGGHWAFASTALVFNKELFRDFDSAIFINPNTDSHFLITPTGYELEEKHGKLLELSNKNGVKSYALVKYTNLFPSKDYYYYQERPLSHVWCENRATGLVEGLILPYNVKSGK